jgi:salicylate hydroxylase
MLKGRRIDVLGAGIAGVAAALALARRGAEVIVHEQAAAAAEVGAGLQIGPHGVRVLRALGLDAVAGPLASEPEAVILRDGLTGRAIARVPMGARAAARWGAPYLQMHRADLLGLLMAAAGAEGVAFRFGRRAEAVTDAGALAFDDGSMLEPDILVAADGIRSMVRAQVAGGHAPDFTGQVAWRGLVAADRVGPVPLGPAAHVFLGPGRHLVAYPLRSGTLWNIVAVEERAEWASEDWRQPAEPTDVRRAFRGWCPAVTMLLDALDRPFLWGLFSHAPLARWHKGRAVLVGDACHPMLPFLAQGATMAIEDAWVLAAMLDRHDTSGSAFAAYQDRRKTRTTRVQKASAANARIYHATGARAAVLRTGMRGLSLLPDAMMARFDWLYATDVTGT